MNRILLVSAYALIFFSSHSFAADFVMQDCSNSANRLSDSKEADAARLDCIKNNKILITTSWCSAIAGDMSTSERRDATLAYCLVVIGDQRHALETSWCSAIAGDIANVQLRDAAKLSCISRDISRISASWCRALADDMSTSEKRAEARAICAKEFASRN